MILLILLFKAKSLKSLSTPSDEMRMAYEVQT